LLSGNREELINRRIDLRYFMTRCKIQSLFLISGKNAGNCGAGKFVHGRQTFDFALIATTNGCPGDDGWLFLSRNE